ncbi:glycosyltransferase family 87 protein [Candidatus Oscillochloris fontis]|uniref:glycosyltransferase family 87 protein n=1 Tax=Candidatus Oscillochloris fontis TaxID=2496868 RepID=UPI00101C1CB4|nr:glycosyltransferase family 87 protein [Candidatus Oscillochloris fontis]
MKLRIPHDSPHIQTINLTVVLVIATIRIVQVMSAVGNDLPIGGDTRAYLASARAITHGIDPIGNAGAVFLPEAPADIPPYFYPPLLALLLVPLASLPYPIALGVWMLGVLATTILLSVMLKPLVGWKMALIGVFFFLPTLESLWLGQINALIAVLIALILSSTNEQSHRRLGMAVAVGALLKITPILAAPVLLIKQRWMSLLALGMTIVGVVLLSLPFVHIETWINGSIYALQSNVSSPLFASWTGILRRQSGMIATLGPPVVILTLLGLTFWRSRVINLQWGLTAATLLPLLISTIIWHYTTILALPALALLWHSGQRGKVIAGATWFLVSLVGGISQPFMLTICWAVCCWPSLLDAPT